MSAITPLHLLLAMMPRYQGMDIAMFSSAAVLASSRCQGNIENDIRGVDEIDKKPAAI